MKINLPKPSLYLLKYGTIFCVFLMLAVLLVFIENMYSSSFSITVDALCKTAAVTVFYVFSEVVIGALFFDIYAKAKR